jgi:hypothetical protein
MWARSRERSAASRTSAATIASAKKSGSQGPELRPLLSQRMCEMSNLETYREKALECVRAAEETASNSSLACDWSAGITRERVTGGWGTRTCPTDFLSVSRHHCRAPYFFRGGIMPNPLYRAERCRDLADECRAIAALCAPSTEIRTHYSRMSEHYSSLAEAEELSMLAYGR